MLLHAACTEPAPGLAITLGMKRPQMLILALFLGALLTLAHAAPTTLVLDPSASEARFLIGENLLGRETVAVGRTRVVQGGVTVDPEDPTTTLVFSAFEVDVSTLATDDSRRDGQIRNNILQTNRAGNGLVTFVPTGVEGLDQAVAIGSVLDLRISGELTIKGFTRTVTFEMSLEVASASELRGSAWTVVRLEDFGIAVPRVPLVARVDEEVRLELDFVLVPG